MPPTPCFGLLLAALTLPLALGAPATAAPIPPPAPGTPAADLRLELVLNTPAVIEPGAAVEVTAELVNTSTTRTIHVVKPGDGSEMGWREPWVHYSATRIAPDGSRQDVSEGFTGRCGLFDPDWIKDIVTLAPGARLDLHTWIPDPSRALSLDERGKVQIRMHYAFRGGRSDPFVAATKDPNPLSDVAAFDIVSNPIDLTIQTPLELRAKVRPGAAKLRVGRASVLSDVLEVLLVNVSNTPVAVRSPASTYTFSFEEKPGLPYVGPEFPTPAMTTQTLTLGPGETASLLGPRVKLSSHADGRWSPTSPGPVTVRVVFEEPEAGRTKRRLVSAPLRFEVAP